jgi:hypothetical protein
MEFYFLNWVQLSYDFGKVVLSGTTQGYFRKQIIQTTGDKRLLQPSCF